MDITEKFKKWNTNFVCGHCSNYSGYDVQYAEIELFADAGTTKDAKIYYELGNSYLGKGDNTAACDAYTKANKGDYAEAAKYQMEHVVKCQ